MPTTKPTVTQEHHERLAKIMQTPTKPPAAPSAQNPSASPQTASKVSALLASLPKPKGIGNKMFVFTGKKKIILDPGGKQEVETVKTVDAKKPHNDEKKAAPEASIENKTTNTKPTEAKKEAVKKGGGAKAFLVVALIIFLGAWAIFWLYFLEFI